ncbi:MAG: SIMPL domain-containing protein [Clostridia bacterium]
MKKTMMMVLTVVLMMAILTGAALAEGGTKVTATGTGEVYVQPDQATIDLGVSEVSADVGQAMANVNVKLNAVREAVMGAGVEKADIATGNLSLYTQYDYEVSGDAPSGYNVSHQLTITVRNLDVLGQVIDAAVKAGANQMNGVSFTIANRQAAYEQALALAVENAQARAATMAKAAGLALGELTELTEDGSGSGYVVSRMMDTAEMGAANTQIDVGNLSVNASVTMVYEATK